MKIKKKKNKSKQHTYWNPSEALGNEVETLDEVQRRRPLELEKTNEDNGNVGLDG
jgi:hypothetical protein